MIPLKRPMMAGVTVGKDVQIAKYGIGRYESGNLLPKPSGGYTQTFGKAMEEAVRLIQKRENLQVTGNIGDGMWAVIWPLLDAYRRWQYKNWEIPKTFEEKAWERLIATMIELDAHTAGYSLGSGHGILLSEFNVYGKSDCSSSTSKVLYEAGLFEGREYAIVSGQYHEWGSPGVGKLFTVYCNYEHVWTRLHSSKWWRFDTSPHGDGGRGPHLRYLPRFTSGFEARHFPGM